LARIKGLIHLVEEIRGNSENIAEVDSIDMQDILGKLKICSEELDTALNKTAEILNRSEA